MVLSLMELKRKRDIARLSLVRKVGTQVALGRVLTCPVCGDDQNLSSIGDHEEILFCPHCDLEIELNFIKG